MNQLQQSLAARLPAETITHILKVTLVDFPPIHRQRARMGLATVCRSWYHGTLGGIEHVVWTNKQAERPSEMEQKRQQQKRRAMGTVTRAVASSGGASVRRLILTTALRSQTKLIAVCKDLRSLELLYRPTKLLKSATWPQTAANSQRWFSKAYTKRRA